MSFWSIRATAAACCRCSGPAYSVPSCRRRSKWARLQSVRYRKRLRDSWDVLGQPLIAADPATLLALAPLGEDALSGMVFLDTSVLGSSDSAAPSPATDLQALAMVFMT